MNTRKRFEVSFTAAALALALAGCGSGPGEQAGKMTSYSSRAAKSEEATLFTLTPEEAAHVNVVTVEPARLTRTLRLTGTVAYNAFQTTPVITPVSGPVARLVAAPGQRVEQGRPLLYVSSPDYSQLRAAYLKSRDAFQLADKNYRRAKDLYDHQAISQRELDQAETDRNQAQADMESSAASLRVLGIARPESLAADPATPEIPVRAPVSGDVVERLVGPGQLLQAGATQCYTISDMRTVWVLVNVYQNDLAYVKPGAEATIQTDAYPDVFHGRISYIASSVDPNTRTLQARIVTRNPGWKLKKDMYVTAAVQAGVIPNALTVPDAAVLRDSENQPFVYVATGDNRFARRAVTAGESHERRTRILGGIQAGERVIADGSLFLQFKNSLQR